MSLKDTAGKNTVSHVGKIYNVLARDIAEAAVATVPEIESSQCLMVRKIGAPVTLPAMVQIKNCDPRRRSNCGRARAD